MAATILQFPNHFDLTVVPGVNLVASELRSATIKQKLRRARAVVTMITDSVDGIEDTKTVAALYVVSDLIEEAMALFMRGKSHG